MDVEPGGHDIQVRDSHRSAGPEAVGVWTDAGRSPAISRMEARLRRPCGALGPGASEVESARWPWPQQ